MTDSQNLTESREHDMYIAQLKEIFDSCDKTGTHVLGRQELLLLCTILNLEDQSELIVKELLKDKPQVGFDEFQESFINILRQTYTQVETSDDDETSEATTYGEENDTDELTVDNTGPTAEIPVKREVSPKYVVGDKRYGRRSRRVCAEDLQDLNIDEDDLEVASSTISLKHSLTTDDGTDSEEDGSDTVKKCRMHGKQDSGTEAGTYTFEAEGQMNLMMADTENLTEEEDYLHGIWRNLDVGQNGYINVQELAKVCVHIGMDQMNDNQLQQLFDKLDADGDGKVSFQEFLNEMFQHNAPTQIAPPTASRSKGNTPTRVQLNQKIKFSDPSERTTSSILHGFDVSGLFSVLDSDRTGFAKPEAIIDLWEKYNIRNGADILLALGFDLNATVNLSQLSMALEQELLSPEEQSFIFQVAAITYQQEMRHLRSVLEQAVWAKEKLKLDLAEANARNSLLAKEVDERHASMEMLSESKLLSIEHKYQNQVKQLQAELESERENFSLSTANHKQSTQNEILELKQEEAKLREQLTLAQKEAEKQSHDLEEVTSRLEEFQKQNQKLQRELDSVQDLQRKLVEFESHGILCPKEQQSVEKLQRLEVENKDLKDHNDELQAELETMKQLMLPVPKPATSVDIESHSSARIGSVMSDYIRPVVVVKKTVHSSAEYSDDDGPSGASTHHLVSSTWSTHHLVSSTPKDDDISECITNEKETISQLKREFAEFRTKFDNERKDIEQAHKLEIAAVEEKHNQEKACFLQIIEEEKNKMSHEFDHLQQQALSELAQQLKTKFAHEKQELVHKHESMKNHIEQKHTEDMKKLSERLKSEHLQDLQTQLHDMKSNFEQEQFKLEEALAETEPFVKQLEEQKSQLELKLVKQKEQHDKELKQQKSEMEDLLTRHMQKLEDVEKHKNDLELKYSKDASDAQLLFKKEKLQLVNRIDQQSHDIRELKQQYAVLEHELNQQRDELETSFRQEKQQIVELYDEKIMELEEKLSQAEKGASNLLTMGIEALKGNTKEDFHRLLDAAMKEKLEWERQTLIESLKNDLKTQSDTKESELSHVFEKEKTELIEGYEDQIQLIRGELDSLQEKLKEDRDVLVHSYESERGSIEEQLAQQIREELQEEFCQQMEEIKEAYDEEKREHEAQINLMQHEVEDLQRSLNNECQNSKKIDELKRANRKLQQEKRQAEKERVELHEALENAKTTLQSRVNELMAEKEGAITAVKAQFIESSMQNGKDKAVYEAVVMEKEALETTVTHLTLDLQQNADKVIELQHTIDELTQAKSDLEERILDLQNRYTEVEMMANTFSHLKFNDGQMPKAPAVVEQTLLEMQEKLADTEAKLIQSEKELKDAMRFKDKYKLLQNKYEDVSKERDKVSHFARTLQNQLNRANTAEKEDHKDKGHLTSVLEEKKQLEMQLQKISDKLLEATTNFSVNQSQHISELQQWKEQCSNMVDLQKYTQLQIDLVDNQRTVNDLQEILKNKEHISTQIFKATTEKHHEEVKGLEEQRESLLRKLSILQQILDGQIDKFKLQFEASEKRCALVVDLYKENADLLDALARVEEQKKDAVSRCYKLEDQCNNLRRLLKRLATAAVT